MACGEGPDACRAKHIRPKLSGAEVKDGADWEAKCPVCGHASFRVSTARERRYRHVWACACRKCRCDPAAMRAALLGLKVAPGCLGFYGASTKASTDPGMAARLDAVSADILAAPHLKPSDMRIVIAEARGQKVPADFTAFVKWAMGIGIGRSQAYEAAARWCRPSDGSPPGEGGVDNQS